MSFWATFMAVKDLMIHGFAIYFLVLVFGATTNENTKAAADLDDEKFKTVKGLVSGMMWFRFTAFIAWFGFMVAIAICYATPNCKKNARRILNLDLKKGKGEERQ